jgi:xylan 1,4-beta-xylosidase
MAESLRADFQKHLSLARDKGGFQYIRMHGLFHEDMMVYREHEGHGIFNFQYIDMVFDHWLSLGMRPFVELGFMPYDMASGNETVFWWQGNITPPKDWNKWSELVRTFTLHCIARYGIDEVRKWYFEVWNEPNLPIFWKNKSFENYMRLYEVSVNSLKNIDQQLKVGGPATSGSSENPGHMPFIKDFLSVCEEKNLPVDFISTHPYPTNHPIGHDNGLAGVDPKNVVMYYDGRNRLLTDLQGLRDDMRGTPYEHSEIHLTEWSNSPSSRDSVHDSAFMTSYIIDQNWMSRGLINSLSFWAVSDIFEECRLGDTPFHGGFGLINAQGIPKASLHAYTLLAELGNQEISGGKNYAVTKRTDGTIVILLWNYAHYAEGKNSFFNPKVDDPRTNNGLNIYDIFEKCPDLSFSIICSGVSQKLKIRKITFTQEHSSSYDRWCIMGKPSTLLRDEEQFLRQSSELSEERFEIIPKKETLELQTTLPRFGVQLLEIKIK